jgi:hypothetical protein
MTNTKNPEIELLTQLAAIRQSLVDERDSLLARAAEIDAALLSTPASGKPTANRQPKATKAPKPRRLRKPPGASRRRSWLLFRARPG